MDEVRKEAQLRKVELLTLPTTDHRLRSAASRLGSGMSTSANSVLERVASPCPLNGFHGFLHAYAARTAAQLLGRAERDLRVVTS
jgi:hypothetical protein